MFYDIIVVTSSFAEFTGFFFLFFTVDRFSSDFLKWTLSYDIIIFQLDSHMQQTSERPTQAILYNIIPHCLQLEILN